ncbi:hypothetical protein C8A05DRAFT_15905 [Staphylotrichum tortipilum]|uniref:Uncharacterized protein n=1 Tax=Staphylotrichum tortipilum TaxID=2831512 RepID=A0AAN6MK32_9PEZI|nr:hypothetical protein C8A05DRAFT_15905 [Staphylotrichum longicolle]
MDGSYGNVFPSGRAMDPNAPPPSNANQYKVNVSRQKTKKWANFKPQNYDGDDWGDDDEFGDEPEPLPPPPAQRPMGPRHAATFSPSTSAGQFQPAGSPPLQTNTAQFPSQSSTRLGQHQAGAAPSPLSGGPPRRVTEPVGSFPHSAPGHTQPQFFPDPRGTSPTPQSAHVLPSQQVPTPTSAVGPSPVPDVLEARSTTPRSAGPVASPTKLPFVRPADLYQRMEEERAKEARPSETPTSSTAAAGGWSREPTGWQPQAQPQPQPQGGLPNQFAGSMPVEANWAPRPSGGLETVAERRSEYGLEGFLDSYGTVPSKPVHAPAPAETTAPVLQKPARAASGQDLRRYSTSPQLPDLGRVSGFGEDFFSTSPFFPASELASPTSDNVQQLPPGQHGSDADKKSPTPAPEASSLVAGSTPQSAGPSPTAASLDANAAQQVPGAGFGAAAAPSPLSSPIQDAPVGLTSHQAVTQPGFSPPEPQAPWPWELAAMEQSATRVPRPHLPGGWVSETPSTPGGAAASPLGGLSQEVPTKAVEPEPTTQVDTDVRATSPSVQLQQSEPIEARGSTELAEESKPAPSPSIAAPAVPPLRTASPALSLKPEVSTPQATSEVPGRASSPASSPAIQTAERNSPVPESATMNHSRVITPTAPLKSQRSTPDSLAAKMHPVLSPPAEPEPAPSTLTASPVEDSDMLSEEIMKSLTPIQPAGSAAEATPASTAPLPEPIRESSYLGDVYGDYWAATEDKAEAAILALGKPAEPETVAPKEVETSLAKPSTGDGLGSSSAITPSQAVPAPAPEAQPPASDAGHRLQRRFSWEALAEEAVPTTVLTPAAEQPAPGPSVEKELNLQPPSPISDAAKSAEDLRAESAPEFNPGATLSPSSVPDRPIPSPSPVSEPTDDLSGARRTSSQAEEKIPLPSLDFSPPVSPSPLTLPQDTHPKPRPDTATTTTTQPQRRAESPSTQTIAFRKIMDMPLPAERIKHFHESRYHISSLDSGLDGWLRATLARHPEHAASLLSPGATTTGAGASTAQLQTPGGAGAVPGSGRMQTGLGGSGLGGGHHLHMPNLQHGLSGLGHSGGQVGTKSKELLMAAGKAGKGLFSKGRNKLRERGDKVFSSGG